MKVKLFKLFILLTLASTVNYSCTESSNKQITHAVELISETGNKFAPDKREAIWQINAQIQNNQLVLIGETDLQEAKNELTSLFEPGAFLDSITILPNDTITKPWALVTVPVANLKSAPAFSAELASQAVLGTPVKILKSENDWFLVQTPDKYISWVNQTALFTITPADFETWKLAPRVIYVHDSGLILDTPFHTGQPISSIYLSSILEKTGQENDFVQVKLADGRTGYIDKTEVMDFSEWENANFISGNNQYKLASSFLGRPYLWGGTSPAAMDCSGFVKTVFLAHGLILGRDASLQALHGELINPEPNFTNLQTGDLLFFGEKSTGKVTHVALYLFNQKYIHSSGMVKINSLDEQDDLFSLERKNSLLSIRRIVNTINTSGIQSVKNHPWYN